MDGHVDDAIRMLQGAVTANGNDSQTHLLLCRAYFSKQVIDDAVRECETAVGLSPKSSAAQDWLGRAYGVKANNSGPLTGLKLAHRVRESFEAAVELDPRSEEAADDLAEYYIGAPAVVGGGLDKADALADRIENSLPRMAHRIRGLAAEKRKDEVTSEREFLAEVAVAHGADAWVDLGGHYTRMKMFDKATDALQHSIAANKAKDASLVDAASYLIDIHAAPDVAMKALQQYLAGNAKSDAAPVIHVYVLVAALKKNAGDRAGAKIELNKALALAANYEPAKRALKGL